MQARADNIDDVRGAVWGKPEEVKKMCRALRKRPKLASPKLPPKRRGDS